MAETRAEIATLRDEFKKNAVLPRKQLVAAEKFITQLSQSVAQGIKPSAEDLRRGETLLKKIENQTQIFMFNAALLAGTAETPDSVMHRQLQAIGDRIDKAEATSLRLRETLKELA